MLLLPLPGAADGTKAPDHGNRTQGTLAGVHGCSINFEVHRPASPLGQGIPVILTHGFLRQQDTMRGWAIDWSGEGIEVVIVSSCNSTMFRGHHQRNADDLLLLSQSLYPDGPVIFAGFSAGGLAAWLAHGQHPNAAGYLGLDPVDSKGLARGQAMTDPGWLGLLLHARPSACNAHNNFLPAARRTPGLKITLIDGAGHCHFENPIDRKCRWFCGSATEGYSNTSVMADISIQVINYLKERQTQQMP